LLARRITDGEAEAARALDAVRDDLNRTRGVPGEAAVFRNASNHRTVIAAENAHAACLRYARYVRNQVSGYQLDEVDEARWRADAERLRAWFDLWPSGEEMLAAAEHEAARAAAARKTSAGCAGAPPAKAEIVHLGECSFQIGDRGAVNLTLPETNVLQAFRDYPGSTMDMDTLIEKSGHRNAVVLLKGIRKKYGGRFACAIRLPGKKASGGYGVSIRRGNSVG
jgi:hypothetical protein